MFGGTPPAASSANRNPGRTPATAHVAIGGLNKNFYGARGAMWALRDVNLTLAEGEFVSVIGPSGCGKSTLLKIIAGLLRNYEGDVRLHGRAIDGPGVDRGVIFQEHRLFPWMTVEENIAANASLRQSEVKARVDELIALVRMTGFEGAYPKELSGGMAQRVAIARALFREPEVLLLDEPFGALDSFTRAHMQSALQEIWQRKRMTTVFVTHDIDEAVFMADRVVVMSARPGRVHDVMNVPLDRPRRRTSDEYQAVRRTLVEKFESLDDADD